MGWWEADCEVCAGWWNGREVWAGWSSWLRGAGGPAEAGCAVCEWLVEGGAARCPMMSREGGCAV
ncbi:hypothetical protein [Lentzea sp. NPDC092896]|uniref:hypothetical protein n=1 Tax=Lentzea sp. NPDC092896 TaxID=3364127 RepID=UPI0037F58592